MRFTAFWQEKEEVKPEKKAIRIVALRSEAGKSFLCI